MTQIFSSWALIIFFPFANNQMGRRKPDECLDDVGRMNGRVVISALLPTGRVVFTNSLHRLFLEPLQWFRRVCELMVCYNVVHCPFRCSNFLSWLHHYYCCVFPIVSILKIFWIFSIFWNCILLDCLQNLIQYLCLMRSIIFI